MIASVTLSRPGPTLPPPAWLPDLTLVAGGAAARPGHRLVLARLSSYTRSLLQASLEQEEACLVIPDLSPRVLDCILGLAYQGKVGGLGSGEIGLVREACRLLHIKEEEFVVRVQERRQEEVELQADPAGQAEPEDCFQSANCSVILPDSEQNESKIKPRTKRIAKKKIGGVEDESKHSRPRKGSLFKFKHYEMREDFCYCTFPGCEYSEPFKTVGGCRNHQLREHATEQEKRFECKFCGKKFASNQLRNKHQNLTHTKRFPCSQCNKVFSEKTRLVIHSRTHSGEKPFVCEDCGFSCAQRDNLRLHKEFKHPALGLQDKKYSCDLCSASFLTRSNLTRHAVSHTDLKEFVCETCGKAFKEPGALRQHSYCHGPAKFGCGECEQQFTSPLYLARHTSRLHPQAGRQPLHCTECDRGFPLKHQLEQHIQAVHRQVKHRCPHCNLLIGRRSSVNRHIKKGRCRATVAPEVDTDNALSDPQPGPLPSPPAAPPAAPPLPSPQLTVMPLPLLETVSGQ